MTKVGEIYSFAHEDTMLELAKELENSGYKVERYTAEGCYQLYYVVKVVGYRQRSGENGIRKSNADQ